jgi:predicted GH43/DUF377 family glycosyl hydrolase
MPIPGVPVERLNQGEPIVAPTEGWWETGVTFNAAAVYLEPSPGNEVVLRALLPMRDPNDPALARGAVAVHYRARPEQDPGSSFGRSFIGLAVFTPDLEPLYRYREPVLYPAADPSGYDALGVEDPRITRLGDTFYMVYCGVAADPATTWRARLCLATSTDLVHWEKLGPLSGDLSEHQNKDGVLFPGPLDGRHYLLHRPFRAGLPMPEYAIRLAVSGAPTGPWRDLGEVLRAFPNPRHRSSWVGAGSVPIPMGGSRFAMIYHTGNFRTETEREYDLDVAVLDFAAFEPRRPASLVTGRLEHLMVPETPAERRSRSALMVGNVLFACGSYEHDGSVYVVYGGADTYTLAARVDRQALFAALDRADLTNPFAP